MIMKLIGDSISFDIGDEVDCDKFSSLLEYTDKIKELEKANTELRTLLKKCKPYIKWIITNDPWGDDYRIHDTLIDQINKAIKEQE